VRGLQHYTPSNIDECWAWRGYIDPRSGYGQFGYRNGKLWAHRMTYEDHIGPIPPKMQIDHLCRNKTCVNPHHMELVTHAENQRRAHLARIGTPRKCGHPFLEGERDCQVCNRERARKNRLAARAGTGPVPVDRVSLRDQ